MWYVDIYLTKNTKRNYMRYLESIDAKEKEGKYGTYWTAKCENRKKVEFSLSKLHLKGNWYKKEWERSSNYRDKFLKEHPKGPYYCRYCNRRLKKEYMEIDHLFPISKAKKSPDVRFLMYLSGINNVNDIKNLVPSCHRCNKNKDSKMGIWLLKGVLGKYKWYWILRKIIIILFVGIVIFLLIRPEIFQNVMNSLKQVIHINLF